MEMLNFEIWIMDMCEERGIKDPEELRNFSDQLHESVEMALQDYASDNGFGADYIPCY